MDLLIEIFTRNVSHIKSLISSHYIEDYIDNNITHNCNEFMNSLIIYSTDNISNLKSKTVIIKSLRIAIVMLKDILNCIIKYQLLDNNNELQPILSIYPKYLLSIITFDYEDSQIKMLIMF